MTHTPAFPLRLVTLVVTALTAVVMMPAAARAQTQSPVYIDDAPRAWELFRLAREQVASNTGEAVRLYQELLDAYGRRVIPRHEATTSEFVSVRTRVLSDLRENPTLLARYRLMQQAEAQRLLAANDLEELLRTRPLTEAGLEAMLRTAQDALESARFRQALRALELAVTHPDLTPDRAAYCWFGIGLAAHYLGRADRVTEAETALAGLGAVGETLGRDLGPLVAAGSGATVRHGTSSLDRAEVSDLTELVAQTIWSVNADQSLLRRRHNPSPEATGPSADYERKRRDGDLTTVSATVAGSTVFINEGHRVRALDRFTGRSVWPQAYLDQPQPPFEHDKSEVGDLSIIAVDGDALVTLTGHALADSRSAEGRVICLDARSGSLRWAVSFDRLSDEEEYEGLFPHGAPLISEGGVYVLARKVSKQMLTGCYIVALDLENGDLEWIRHIASSGSRTKTARPFSSLVCDDGDLFVSSAVGAIACLDAMTGDARWVRRYSVPVNVRSRSHQPWEMSGPVLMGDRVIAITPDQRRVTLLDRATGDAIETLDAWTGDRWNSPSYLLATEKMIYAIGSEVRAFNVDNLRRPVWQLPAARESMVDDVSLGFPEGKAPTLSSEREDLTIVGRVQLVNGALIVPTAHGVLVVDDETGHVSHRLAINVAGNPVATGAQLILASGDTVQAYMSLSRAEQMLRDRIAATPGDPEAALSLLQLGMRVGDLPLALEGADLSLQSIGRMPRDADAEGAREELFNMLLEIHRRRIATIDGDRDALYGMIGAVASTTKQRVEYLLAYGDGLSDRAPARAVETYQAVLSDAVLRATVRSESGLVRPASYWACERLARLMDSVGPGAYDPQAAFARELYEHIVATSPADAEGLRALAAEFPYADAAVDAALAAAGIERDRGNVRGGFATIASLYHLAPSSPRASRLLGALVEMCIEDGRDGPARRMLAATATGRGDEPIETGSGPRTAREWLADLAPTAAPARLPHVRELERPLDTPARMLAGRVLSLPPETRRILPPDRALLLTEKERGLNDLRLVSAETLEPIWTTEVDADQLELLHMDRDEVLLDVDNRAHDPRVVALNASSGRVLWTTPPLAEHIPAPLAAGRIGERQMPDGRLFEPDQVLPRISDDAVFLVRRTGGAAAFDRATGHVLWTAPRTVDQVHDVLATDFGLALIGMNDVAGGGDPIARIVVLDPRDGRVIHEIAPYSPSGVLWAKADALGTMLCATEKGLEAIDLFSGRRRWTNVAFDATEVRKGWAADDAFIIENRSSSLFTVDAEGGRLSQEFDTDIRGNWERDALQTVVVTGERILAHYRDRVVRYDRAGNVRGADIIAENRDFRWLLEGDDRLVVVSQHDTRQVPVDESGERETQWTYHVYVLSDSCKLEGEIVALEPLRKRLVDAALIDGWLLLSTDAETWALEFRGD